MTILAIPSLMFSNADSKERKWQKDFSFQKKRYQKA